MSTMPLPRRADMPVERTWDATSVFPDDDAWLAALEGVRNQLPLLEAYRGSLGSSPERLADWLQLSADTMLQAYRAYIYASMFYTVDTTNQEAGAKVGRAGALFAQLRSATAFAEPEITAIGADTLRDWVAAQPRLALHGHYFTTLANRAPHLRSAEIEQVIALAGEPLGAPGTIQSRLTQAELTFAPATAADGAQLPVAQSTIGGLLTHADRAVRRSAFESYADGHLAFRNTLTACLEGAIKSNLFNVRVRGYDSALAAALAPHQIPQSVFHNLIDVFQRNLPTWHRYWRVRRRALGYETLGVYDIKAPLSAETPHVPYEKAVHWIAEGMAPLGDDYVAALRRGCLEERWVDVYPNQGKRQGAFSSGAPGTHPFIMMSYGNDLYSLSTLAHELGHSLHSYLTWQTQPPVYAGYSLFAAEVASNFNQALVRDYLLRTQDDRNFQIALLEEALSNFHRYFFIMPTLARFELEAHQRVQNRQPLTADGLIGLMAELFREGYGDEVAFDHDRIGITWAQFGHLYQPFYVYQYATGISGAHALARRILDGEPGSAESYLTFLRAGGSQYPLPALRQAGVDLASPEPVEAAFAVLAGLVDRLEQLVG